VVFRLLFSFCDLVFTFSLRSVFAKKNLEWYFVFRFYKIWYFDFPLFFAIWYFCFVSAIVLVFHLLFSFCNLVFAFSFCKKKIWSDILSSASAKSCISTFLQLLPWYLLPKRLFGYDGYLLIWEFSFLILLLCIVTTRVLFRLLTTQFFKRTKHIEIDCHLTCPSSQAWHHYFAFCSFFLADFFTKMYFISCFRFLVGKLSMLVAAALWVWGEMLNNIYLVLFIKGIIVFLV